jgi:hypothetical protein
MTKRTLLILLILTSIFSFACKTTRPITAPSYSPGVVEKRVVIALSDDSSGAYKVEGPLPDSVYLRPGQIIRWSIVNNTKSAVISSVTIDDFHTTDNRYRDPFDGGSSDQEFNYTDVNLQSGQENSLKASKIAKAVPAGETRIFKYKVTVKIAGIASAIIVDPQVVVGE